jgi:hypothetical protein
VLRLTLRVAAVIYLLGIWLDGVGCDAPPAYLPLTVDYFLDVAALFPDAAKAASEFRAEGWLCRERTWEELDVRPYFPLDPDDKENRFQRALNIFRNEPIVTKAMDDYLVKAHNDGRADDGIARDESIGGVRFTLIRAALPPPGGAVKRYTRRSLVELAGEKHRILYQTSQPDLKGRCGYVPASGVH